ncbi:Vam6/Vps39-like protein [Schistosoma japonicum]|nr:Vam6/Vps39-like protein [Schistosoma japonicum]
MYSAFLPVRLLSDYPYPLECLTCYDNFLLVGTKQGLLLVYELTPKVTNHPEFFIPNLNCLSSHPKVIPFTHEIISDTVSSPPIPAFFTHVKITRTLGKKPITQLTAIPEFDILLALADGRMSVYQLQNCQLITSVPNSKNAGLFTHCIEHSKIPNLSSWNTTDNPSSLNVSHSSSKESILSEPKSSQLSKSNSLELRICVVVKRHLYFWRWNPYTREFICPGGSDDLLTFSWPNELTTPEVVRSVTFCGLSKLIVGHRGEYLLINIESGEMQFISAPGKNQLPIVTSLSHCLDLTNLNECDHSWTFNKSHFPKNSTTMNSFIGSENSLYQSTLDFTEGDSNDCPSNHYYQPMLPGSYSFLGIERDDVLSIVSPFHEFKSLFQIMDNALEIRIMHPNKLIQQLAITRVTAMCHSNGWFYASTAPAMTTTLFITDSSHSYQQNALTESTNSDSTPVRGKNTNSNEVWLILSANRLKFIQDLVKQQEFELAICLAKTALYSGQNAVETSQITILYGIHLYHEKKYSEALNLFTEQLINPIHILGLFPGMLSEQEQHQIVYPCDVKIINSSQMIDAYEPLITYLLTWRRLLKQQSNSVKLFIKPSKVLNSTTLDGSKLSLSNNKNEQHHSDTVNEFKCYSIKDFAKIVLPFTKLLELIDTSLLKCYLSTNTARVAPLLRQENACILDESVKTLLKHKRYQELIMLYQSRGLHHEALSILQQFNIIRAKQFGNAVSITETEVKLPFTITLDENMNNVGLIEQLGHPKRIIHYFIHYLDAYHLNLLTDYSKSYIIHYYPISWMRIVYCWEKKLNMKYRSEILENVFVRSIHHILFELSHADRITTDNYEKEEAGHKITKKSKCKPTHHLNENRGELKQSILKNLDHKLNKYSPRNVLISKIPSVSQLSCASSLDSMQSGCISPEKCSNRFKDILTSSLWPLPDQHDFKRSRLVNLIMNSSHKENNPSKIYDPDILPSIPQYPSYIDVCDVHTRYAVALIRRAQTLQPATKPFAFKVNDEQPKSGAVARLRLRFMRFLMHPGANYSFSRLLAKCPCDSFFEERAFLLAKLNKHEQALSLWVHLLNDWNSAVNHCITVYQKGEHSLNNVEDNKTDNAHTDFDSSSGGFGAMIDEKLSLSSSQNLQNFSPSTANSPSLDKNVIYQNNKNHNETVTNSSHNIFFLLMQICLQPTEPASLASPSKFTPFTPKPKKALEILHQFSTFVDPVKVIRITPTVALSSVGNYLKNTFICQESTLNQLVFLQNAAKSELIASCTDRIKATSNHFSVLPSTRCRTCRRRIGNSAFVRQPTSDELEHYGCCKDLIEKR